MKRRTFLASAGSASIGASALISTGAFSRVESDRAVSIAVAEDADAYLGLDKCRPDGENPTPNASYAWPDDKGHLRIFMDDKNPTIGESPLGEGINSNSTSIFDRVFQICNQGKETVCVWIEDDEEWPKYDGDRRVDFYLEDTRDESIIGEEYGVELEVGQCVCVGISVRSHGLEEGDTVLDALDDQITIVADVDGVCGRVPPEEIEEDGDIDGYKAITEGLEDYYDCIDLDEDDRLSGWTIELYDGDCETFITDKVTNENGYFQFIGLDPGTYCVCEEPKPGTVQIEPEDTSCHTVEVEAGETTTVTVDGETYAFLNGIAELQGCSPGFWCNPPQRFDWWSDSESVGGWYTDDTIGDAFESEGWLEFGGDDLSDLELGDAVCRPSNKEGSDLAHKQRKLARHATAALLNAAHESIDYKFSESEIIDEVVDVIDDGDTEDVSELSQTFDDYNNMDCPIDAHGDLEEEKA